MKRILTALSITNNLRYKRILALLLSIVMIGSLIPLASVQVSAYSSPPAIGETQIMNKINRLVELLDGKYFTTTQKSCGNNSCDACKNTNVFSSSWFIKLFGNVSANQIPGHAYPNGGSGTPAGWTCHGFANFAMWYIFSSSNNDKVSYKRIIDNVSLSRENMLKYAKPGDVIRYGNHSVVLISINSNDFTVIDCNAQIGSDGYARVRKHNITYKSSTMAVSRATNYETTPHSCVYSITEYEAAHPHKVYTKCSCGKIGGYTGATTYVSSCSSCNYTCSCSSSHAGTYTCTTTTYPLTIRSGHGTSYSAIGSIPSGATVTVTKANGSWAHVEYNGVVGYASMEYLSPMPLPSGYPVPFKCYPLSDSATRAADAYDAINGNHIGYIYGTDYCTVKQVYSNGWCLVNCPWNGSTKDVYAWTGAFLAQTVSPYWETVQAESTTYIRLSSSGKLGYVSAGDKVLIINNTSAQAQIIYPHTDGTNRCAWVDYHPTFTHVHTPGPAATCTSPQVCTSCDAIIAGITNHTPGPAATCTSNQTCTVCGVILNSQKAHTPGAAATCTIPQTCTVCGVTLNKAKGHDYTAGSYTQPAHPHTIYDTCACGAKWASGESANVPNCTECYPAPTISGITYSPATVKVGDTVTFTLNATGATSYQLVIGDGTNVLKRTEKTANNTVTYTFTSEGSYAIWGYAYNGETSATAQTISVTVSAATITVNSISLNKSSTTIDVGDTLNLTATVSPTNATNKAVTWTSSDTLVATVTNGTVTALKAGTTTITATTVDGSKIATCTVTVTQPVTGVTLNKASTALTVGATVTLTATVAPGNATNKAVTWASSNPSVATVTNGTVTALKAGTTTITATTVDGSKTAACVVTVEDTVTSYEAYVYTEAKKTVVQGSQFTYTVSLAGSYDGFSFEIASGNGLTVTDITTTNSNINIDEIGDKWMISVLGGLAKNNAEKEELVTVTVQVASDAELGARTLTLSNLKLSNESGDKISAIKYEYASIEVTDQIPGDINGDGTFDYYDVSKLYAFYRNKTTLADSVDTDVNGDGDFDYYDVSKLYAIYRGKANFN